MFEYVALAGLSDMDKVSVLAALVVFRLCYLIIPLIVAVIVVIVFERGQFGLSPPTAAPRRNRRGPNDVPRLSGCERLASVRT